MRLTVGPLPASVYWRRRAIVLAGALLVVFLIAQACMATASPGGDAAAPPTSSAPAGSPPPTGPVSPTGAAGGGSPEPSEGAASGDPSGAPAVTADSERCADADMRITASASRTEFSSGETVQFEIRIRNDSGRTCSRDIGGELRELSLYRGTGADKVWSSQHCGGPTGSNVTDLPPGHEEAYYIEWNGRSTAECDGGEPDGAVVESGEYQLFARLGDLHSEPVELTVR